jgi:hypothetical protein
MRSDSMPLLTPDPSIGPGFKTTSPELTLRGVHNPITLELNEHTSGGFSAALFQTDSTGRRNMVLLGSEQTDRLRRLLNRAYRERG